MSVAQAAVDLAVGERPSVGIENNAAGRAQHGVAGRRVPFHCWRETRIDVAEAFGDETEFERRAGAARRANRESFQERFRLRVSMRAAYQRDEALGRATGPDSLPLFYVRQSLAERRFTDEGRIAADPQSLNRRRIDCPGDRRAAFDQRHIDRELAVVRQEFPGPIKRIHEQETPDGADRRSGRGRLFGADRGRGRHAREVVADDRFGAMIGRRNRTAVLLRPNVAAALVFLHHRRTGRKRGLGEKQGNVVARAAIERERYWAPRNRVQDITPIRVHGGEAFGPSAAQATANRPWGSVIGLAARNDLRRPASNRPGANSFPRIRAPASRQSDESDRLGIGCSGRRNGLSLRPEADIEPGISRLTMASLTPLDLAALLCSRVCHDVISPVGAIVNGLEVLDGEQDEEMRAVAMEFIKKSAISASARLQFCRLAFGAAGSFGASIDTGDAEKVARDIFASDRTVLEWTAARRLASRNSVKLLLNLCLIAAGSIHRGGVITVDLSDGEDVMTMRVEAKGANARLSHSAADILTSAFPAEAIDGHSIQLYFTTLLARECQATLNVSSAQDTVTLTATPPAAPAETR